MVFLLCFLIHFFFSLLSRLSKKNYNNNNNLGKEIQLANIQAEMYKTAMSQMAKIEHLNVTESSLLVQNMFAPLLQRGVGWITGGLFCLFIRSFCF